MTSYPHQRYNDLIESTVAQIKKLGELKGGEYAGDTDRLANFRRNGVNLGLNMETIWAVYAGKHWDAINQFIQDLEKGKTRERMEPIEGRVDDMLVYLILFKAMLDERNNYSPAQKMYPAATETFGELRAYADPRHDINYTVGANGEESK